MMSASKTLKKNLSIAVAAVFLAVAAFACWAIEPSKAYADTTDSHLAVASEVHVLVDSEGNVTIPNATVTNDGTCAAYIMGCSSPDGLGWTCDAVGKRIEVGQSITATWRSAGPVSDEIAAQLGEEPYYAGNLTYTYTDGDLKGTVSLDNTDPTVGDTITATVTGANVPDHKLTYQWYRVKDGVEAAIDGATGSTYTATDDDAGYELVCKVSSTDDICQGTICGATGAVKKILAFAVYSADDGSLSFYKRAEVPKQGTMYLGKRATAVYTGLENMTSIPGWMLNYSKDIKTAIVYDEGISPIGTGFWFAELRNMKTADVSKLDMSKCKTIGCMFTNCTSLTSLDLSTWDTRSLTDMNQAFQNCTSLTKLNVSGWDVSKVTNMTLAFAEDRALSSLDLSTWDNSAVTSMKDVFSMMDSLNEVSLGSKFKFVGTSPFLPDQTGHVTGADGKWYDTDGNGYAPADIPSNKAMTYTAVAPKTAFAVYSADDNSLNFYKRAGIPSAGEQFEGKTATAVYTGIETMTSRPWSGYASKIKTATVIDESIQPKSTASWFYFCTNMMECDLSKLDTSSLTNASGLFGGCSKLTSLDLSSWSTANVTDMSYMFSYCSNLTSVGDLSGWNTSSLTNASGMFSGCSKLTTIGDLSGWNTSNVTKMGSMFSGCSKLTTIGDLSGWNTSNVTNMDGMFYGCNNLTTIGDLSGWNTSNVTKMDSMFYGCNNLTTLGDLSSWSTANVPDMSYMFSYCSNLTTIGDLSCWDTSNVTNMSFMFAYCKSLTSIGDLSSWDTSNVTSMSYMFDYCSSLTTLGDLSGWDTSNVTNMNSMFAGCPSLRSLDLSGWDTSNVTNMGSMFYWCSNLTKLDLSGWNTSNVTDMSFMFYGCNKLSTDCSKWNVSKVTDHGDFNTNAAGVTVPLAWQTSNDEGVEDSAITPLCEEQENGDALSVSSRNDNNKTANKTDGEASADSEAEGSNTASATDEAGAKEETSDDIVQEKPAAA